MEEIYCFAGNPFDRAAPRRRDAAWIAGLLAAPDSLVLPFHELRPLLRQQGAAPALGWEPVSRWRALIEDRATLIFLGLADGRAHFALDATALPVPTERGLVALDARAAAAALPGPEAAIVAEARSLIDWHARHRYCAACGTPSEVTAGGWMRLCPNCRAHHFPRVDPVVIMLAVRGDRGLLGRGQRRPANRFSCLAGFMEPGETVEEAVRREIQEESGIVCGRVRYLATQPWPFPSTLMIGCLAEALTEAITIDPDELAEARWFARDEVREMVARSQRDNPVPELPCLPTPLAIGHQIARRWAAGEDL